MRQIKVQEIEVIIPLIDRLASVAIPAVLKYAARTSVYLSHKTEEIQKIRKPTKEYLDYLTAANEIKAKYASRNESGKPIFNLNAQGKAYVYPDDEAKKQAEIELNQLAVERQDIINKYTDVLKAVSEVLDEPFELPEIDVPRNVLVDAVSKDPDLFLSLCIAKGEVICDMPEEVKYEDMKIFFSLFE